MIIHMKIFKLFAICSFVFLFAGCERQDLTPGVVGFWQGKYGIGNNYPGNGYSYLFRGDGTVRVFDGSDTTLANKAEGTYTFLSYDVTTTYTFLNGGDTYSSSGKVNVKLSFIEGTWGRGKNTSGMGSFFITRQ